MCHDSTEKDGTRDDHVISGPNRSHIMFYLSFFLRRHEIQLQLMEGYGVRELHRVSMKNKLL